MGMKGNNQTLTYHEYEKIDYKHLSSREQKQLEYYNNLYKGKLFTFYKDYIKLNQYVGVIQIAGKTIEIFPKFGKGVEDKQACIKNLLHMLSYTKRLALSEVEIARLTRINSSVFEIFIRLFVNNLTKLVRRGFLRNYVDRSDNLNYIKGKINFTENIRNNTFRKDRIFCDYDEFSENIPINQIIKYTMLILKNRTTDGYNFKKLMELIPLFSEIDLCNITRESFKKLHFNRKNDQFRPIIDLCYQFIFNESIEMSSGKFSTFSFLFDMNKLFEEFIYEFMRRNSTDLDIAEISFQYRLGYLLKYSDKGQKFYLKPDIHVKMNNGKSIIIDTKYKTPESTDEISNQDIYQMFAYGSRHLEKTDDDKIDIILLYPKAFSGKHNSFYTSDQRINIHPRFIDLLSIEDLSKRESNLQLIEELTEILAI